MSIQIIKGKVMRTMPALMKDSVGSRKPGGLKNMGKSSEKDEKKHVVQAITRKPCTKLINK
jgi:hypothetical protein